MDIDVWGAAVSAVFGTIIINVLAVSIVDVGKWIIASTYMIRLFDVVTLYRTSSKWRGTWHMNWGVVSTNFPNSKQEIGNIYHFAGHIAFDRIATTKGGSTANYGFVGKLSREGSVVTGKWYNKDDTSKGYHGAFQLIMFGPDNEVGGEWVGFSSDLRRVNSGKYHVNKISSVPGVPPPAAMGEIGYGIKH